MTQAIRIGTRSSRLARIQTEWVAEKLRRILSPETIRIQTIRTQGDSQQDVPLQQIGGQGVFTKELELALLDRRIDVAVHSLKDLPSQMTPSLILAAIPKRESPYDALVCSRWHSLLELPEGATVGTSSPRRQSQLWAIRPDLNLVNIRGNLDTRIQRVTDGDFDATILAHAGLLRQGRTNVIAEVISPDHILPAVGQGALAVQIRAEDQYLRELLSNLVHPPSALEAEAERTVLAELRGGCMAPVAALARVQDGQITLTACVCSPDGGTVLRTRHQGSVVRAKELGREAARKLISEGAEDIIAALRQTP